MNADFDSDESDLPPQSLHSFSGENDPPGFGSHGPEMTPPRKAFSYVGQGLAVLGVVLFLSTFFTAAANFGDFTNFKERARSTSLRALTGMVLMVIGAVIAGMGKRAFRQRNESSGSFESHSESPIMIRCGKCNSLCREADSFCSRCGTRL